MVKKLLAAMAAVTIMGGTAVAGGHGKAKTTPSEALKEVVEGNAKWVESHTESYFKPHMNAQHPIVTMITCSDARVHPTVFFKDPVDKVFVIRNVGNQLVNAKGSIDYGIYHLHTPILLIIGHTHCGAVKAALHDYSKETEGIKMELDHLHLPLSKVSKSGAFEKRWLEGVEKNVNYQVDEALKFYKPFIEKGELAVVGVVYDFINAYGKGYGRLVVLNINGESTPSKLKYSPVMKKLSSSMKKAVLVTK